MRFVFRADANLEIGSGHIMRAIGIFEELVSQNFEVIFVGDLGGIKWLEETVERVGFAEIHSDKKSFWPNSNSDVLIFDTYSLPIDDEFINNKHWKFTIVLADETTPDYKVDLRVILSLQNEITYENAKELVFGGRFIPFRKEIKEFNRNSKNDKLNILVLAGGVDRLKFVSEISLELVKLKDEFTANCFTNNPSNLELDSRFNSFPIGSSLIRVARDADLVFTTSSTSSLEFIAMGCAVGISCAFENQLANYNGFTKIGIAQPIGKFDDNRWNLNSNQIQQLVSSSEKRNDLIVKAKDLFQLDGAKNIIDKVFTLI